MANELKPCPFCNGSAEIVQDSGSFFARCENSACPPAPQTPLVDDTDTAANDWNTRPAAPVEGLETVAWECQFTDEGPWQRIPNKTVAKYSEEHPVRELVTRSQAEAIIAARDVEIAELKKSLTDREWISNKHNEHRAKYKSEKEALETQLAAARKALERADEALQLGATEPGHTYVKIALGEVQS